MSANRTAGFVDSPMLDSGDPYGIAQVSGFYGPGQWSGWFLAVISSAIRIYTNPYARFDPNTWLFVVGTNWAAVDVFRTLPMILRADDASVKVTGTFSAALMFTFWGNIFAAMQLLILFIPSESERVPTQRIITHLIGLALPSFAQTAVFLSTSTKTFWLTDTFILGRVDLLTIPFLYMGISIDINWRSNTLWGFFCTTLVFSIIIGVTLPALLIVWLYRTYNCVRCIGERLFASLKSLKRRSAILVCLFYLCVGVTYLVFSGMVYQKPAGSSFPILFLSLFPIMFPAAVCATATFIVHFVFIICGYLMALIVTGFQSWSAACFFMPCAPQSIFEWDQAYSLVVGIILLFGVEILPAVMKHRKDRRDFVEDLESRMEAA